MAPITYLTRRSGGFFYVQTRVRFFSGKAMLLRFSLRTRSYSEARPRLFTYLRWLLPMQSPAEIDGNIDLILAQVDAFLREGVADEVWQAHHRCHYLRTATTVLAEWRDASPCPIRYARFYARQKEFARALTALGALIFDDFEHHDIVIPDANYLRPPQSKFEYRIDESGVVDDVIELDAPSHWPNIPFFLAPDQLANAPRYGIGDIFGSAPEVVPHELAPTLKAVPQRSASNPTSPQHAPASSLPQRPSNAASPLLSVLLVQLLLEIKENTGGNTAERDVKPYVNFAIHIMGDQPIDAYTRDDIRKLCLALPQIPHQKAMTVQSPIERYEYAKAHGWQGLGRLSETTIANRYICGLKRCWSWAKEAGFYQGDLPAFKLMGNKNTTPLVRDAFTDGEVTALFEMPMFTGHMRHSRNKAGPVLRQDHIYWSYIIMNVTGMHPAEIAQLEIEDLRLEPTQGIFYFDLRPFDPAKGRVTRETVKVLKTESAARLVPVHPALIELGLLERANKLAALGHTRLFPECQPKVLNGTDLKWGHALAKDWQLRKAQVTQRANVSAYSGRHSVAELLRQLDLSAHDREKFLGHSHPGVNGNYGRKGLMPDRVVTAFVNMDAPIVRWLRDHLVGARDRIEARGMLIEDWAIKPKRGTL